MTSQSTLTRDHLTPADLAQFEAALRQQREFRITQLTELEHTAGPGAATAYAPEIADALRHAAWHALGEVDRALERLRAGRYGACLTCGSAIGRDRLEILPAAALCMACQRRVAQRAGLRPNGVAR
jgi:RNA polymerase-binding transcription factor DksA